MDIGLGKKVVGIDGKEVGTVDRLVLHPETREITEIIIHKGLLLTEDRVVPISSVRRVDNDGTVHLGIASDAVDRLPLFVEHAYYLPTEEEYSTLPYIGPHSAIAPSIAAPVLWGAPPAGRPLLETGADMVQAEAVPHSALSDELVTIDRGTKVFDRHGGTVGEVDEVQYDAHGRMTGIVVTSGLIRKHEYRVPADKVEKVLGTEVWLSVTEAELTEA